MRNDQRSHRHRALRGATVAQPGRVGGAGAVWLAFAILGAGAAPGCGARRAAGDTAAPEDTSVADKHYDVAVGSFHNGMYGDAKLNLDRALTADPKHADSHYLKGVLLLNEGRTMVDAVEIERCLVDESADQSRARAELLHQEARGEFEEAANLYEEGGSGRGRAHNSMAVVDLFFHAHDSAAAQARAALAEQFYTDRYSALANLGWAYYSKGSLVEATTELRQAVMINPDFCVGRYRLAQVYLDSDRPDLALEHATVVADDERCPIQDAHRIVGVANLRLGREESAQAAFRACVDLSPRSCLALDCSRFLGPDSDAGVGQPTVAQRGAQAAPAAR